MEQDKKKISKSIWMLAFYTVCFMLLSFLLFGVIAYYGKSYIGGTDAASQVAPFMQYTGEYYRGLLQNIRQGIWELPQWDMSVGMGLSVLQVVSFRPIFILCAVIGVNHVSEAMMVYAIIVMYLMGLSYIGFVRSKGAERMAAVMGALIYIFSGYLLTYSLYQTTFLEMFVLLPLILWMTDRVVEKRKYFLYLCVIAYTAIAHGILILYMLSLVMAAYLVMNYWWQKEKSIIGFLKYILRPFAVYVSALLLTTVLWLPKLMMTLGSGRSGGVSQYQWIYTPKEVIGFLLGIVGARESTPTQLLLMAVIVIPALILLYIRKDAGEREKRLRIYGIILLVLMLLPFGTYLFCAFSGSTERWYFIVVFYAAVVTTFGYTRLQQLDKREMLALSISTMLYLVLGIIAAISQGAQDMRGAIFLAVYVCILILYKGSKKLASYLPLFVVAELAVFILYAMLPGYGNRVDLFLDRDTLEETLQEVPAEVLANITDTGVYRVEYITSNTDPEDMNGNLGIRTHTNGLNGYFSYMNGNIVDAVDSLAYRFYNAPFNIADLDNRNALYDLGSVKYVIYEQGCGREIPWGFKKVLDCEAVYKGEVKTYTIYRNQCFLPLMYSYDSVMSQEAYDKLPAYKKEMAMMQSLVTEDGTELSKKKQVYKSTSLLTRKEIEQQIKGIDGIELTENGFLCKKQNVVLTLTLPDIAQEESSSKYLYMSQGEYRAQHILKYAEDNLTEYMSTYQKRKLTSQYFRESWTLGNKGILMTNYKGNCNTAMLWSEDGQYYRGARDLLVNMGRSNSRVVKIVIAGVGEYRYDDIQIVSQPLSVTANMYNELAADAVWDTVIQGNQIMGNISVSQAKMLCVAVPYDTGWHATVNGQSVEITQANGMYMAIPISAGQNQVVLTYQTPGLREGALISGITMTILFWGGLWFITIYFMKKRGKNNEDSGNRWSWIYRR